MAGNKIPHISASFVILFILYLQSLFGETLLILFLASGFTTYFLLGISDKSGHKEEYKEDFGIAGRC